MIDTVSLRFQQELEVKQLSSWVKKITKKPGNLVWRRYTNRLILDHNKSILAIYYPPNPGYPNPSLNIEFSIPNILFGNNVAMIENLDALEQAIRYVNEQISKCRRMPSLNLLDGVLGRADFCYNHHVGESVQNYIRALWGLEYPHRETRPYKNQGIQYYSKVISSKFYDKFAESHRPSAAGILRQEITPHRPYYLQRMLGIRNPTIKDLNVFLIKDVLQDDLNRLRLKDCQICNRELALTELLKKYGFTRGVRTCGYLCASLIMSKDKLKSYGGNNQSIQRYEKMISEAGISLSIINSDTPLPPLVIE